MSGARLTRVTKPYSEVVVIPSLDLPVDEGGFTVIVGLSGCGKSATLRMVAGQPSAAEKSKSAAGM